MIDQRLGRIEKQLSSLIEQTRSLAKAVRRIERAAQRRPDRIVYRPDELCKRLRLGRTSVYKLWNSGRLDYAEDTRGRFSTEEQVTRYLEQNANN